MKSSDNDQNDQDAVDDDIDEEEAKDTVAPYQRLLSELRESASHADMFAPTSSSKATAKQRLSKTDDDEADTGDESENDDEEEEKEEEGDEEEEEEATQPDCLNSYAQEVLCKDRLEESEDALNNGQFDTVSLLQTPPTCPYVTSHLPFLFMLLKTRFTCTSRTRWRTSWPRSSSVSSPTERI